MSVMTLSVMAIAAVVSFLIGSMVRKLMMSGREAELKRNILDAKGAIPQLESSLRNRDQQITRQQHEMGELKGRLHELEERVKTKESEVLTHQREARQLSSELGVLKDSGVVGGNELEIDGGFDDDSAPSDAESKLLAQLEKMRTGYEALKRGVLERDERIEVLEAELNGPDSGTSGANLESQLVELGESSKSLASTVEERDVTIAELRDQLEEERKEREMLANVARSRSDANRELKEKNAEAVEKLPKLMETIKSRNAEIERRNASIKGLQSELGEVKADRAAREADIVALHADVAQRDESLAQQADDIEAHKRTMAEREAHHQQVISEHDAAHKQTLAARDAAHQETVAERDVRIGELDAQLTALQGNFRQAQATIAAREAAVVKQQGRIEETRQRAETAEHANATLQSAMQDRDFKIESLSTDMDRLSGALDHARHQVAHLKAQEASQATAHHAELDELTQQLVELTQQLETTKREFEARRADLRIRDQRIESLEDEILGYTKHRTELESAAASLEVRNGELESELIAAQRRCEDTETAVRAEQAHERTALKNALKDRDFRIDALMADVSTLERQLRDAAIAEPAAPNDPAEAVAGARLRASKRLELPVQSLRPRRKRVAKRAAAPRRHRRLQPDAHRTFRPRVRAKKLAAQVAGEKAVRVRPYQGRAAEQLVTALANVRAEPSSSVVEVA